MNSYSMLEKLVLYFIFKTKGYITKTQLVKFIYLTDLYSHKWDCIQLTDVNWQFYKYGPWTEEIDNALKKLSKEKYFLLSGSLLETEEDIHFVKLSKQDFNFGDLNFPIKLRLNLENIHREWAGLKKEKIKELLNYVYVTAPMIEIKTKHTWEDKASLDLSLERSQLLQELGV